MTAPPLIRARWDVLKIVLERPDDPVAVEQQAALSGLRALTLFARPVMKTTGAALTTDGFVEETLAILRICQHADDELTLLAEICGLVRQQLHAAAVAFIAASDGRAEPIVHDGPRIDLPIAERAIETGLTIAPHRVQERLEAAATVMYGGRAIGALCVRWTVGGTDDLSRAPGLLSMAATAAAPIVSALLVRRTQARTPTAPDLLGITSAMSDLRRAVERAAPAPFAVLIEGESGSGKELVARAIHRGSPRRDRTFCTLNCAALPDDLVEAELFGHARGAFTGAVADRAGVFEEAHGGTLFLDEIGELSPRAQAKILRVIQEGELRRVGENTARRIDTRIVSATNRDLRREVEAGRFRLDLSYRLDVIHISVPPLRDRRDDVAVLVDHFWSDATRRIGSHATLAATTRSVLARYHWPGNVRELQNVMAALAVRCPKRGIVPPSALPPHLVGAIQQPAAWELASARRTFEEGFVRAALARSGGHRGRTAADLGVTRQGLTKLMSRLGIED
jgi:DNA-binding NtrC family response regulator